jgi:LysR family transcriptional activator of nhaA
MSLTLNYHHLYYFWITAKAGRVSDAARQLFLSQPALSMQIRQLERSFGKRLLERSRQGVALTAEGRIAFDYSERIFSQGEELAASFQKGQGVSEPRLRLGVAGAVSRHVVTQILERVHAAGRSLRVIIQSGTVEGLRSRLERHHLDLVVSGHDFSQEMGLEFRGAQAGSIPVDFVGAAPLLRGLRRFPRDLAALPMLLSAANSPVRKGIDLFLFRNRIKAMVEAEVEDPELLRLLALRGAGVAALDALTIRDDLKAGRLKKANPRPLRVRQQVWLVCGRHPKPNLELRAVIEDLMTRFRVRL